MLAFYKQSEPHAYAPVPTQSMAHTNALVPMNALCVAQTSAAPLGGSRVSAEQRKTVLESRMKALGEQMASVDGQGIVGHQMRRAYYVSDSLMDAIYCCTSKDANPHDLDEGLHDQLNTTACVRIKRLLMFLIFFFYVFCVLWLIFAIQSVSVCSSNSGAFQTSITNGAMQGQGAPAPPFTCGQLLDTCRVPYISSMSVLDYYQYRLCVYLISALPFLFLISGSAHVTETILRLVLPSHDELAHAHTDLTNDAEKIRNGLGVAKIDHEYKISCLSTIYHVFFSPDNYDMDSYIKTSAFFMMFTHVIMGALTIYADISVISFFAKLYSTYGNCASLKSIDIGKSDQDRACACQAIFPAKNNGGGDPLLMRFSGIQLMYPMDVAWALVVFNIIYTLFGLSFVFRTIAHSTLQNSKMRRGLLRKETQNQRDYV